MWYRKEIIKMLDKIKDYDSLRFIYDFVRSVLKCCGAK
jgi:hypothetical protein